MANISWKPICAFICGVVTLVFVLISEWYSKLSSKVLQLVVASSGATYVLLVAFLLNWSTLSTFRIRMNLTWKGKLIIQVIVCGIIIVLMDEFGERRPEYGFAVALFFAAFHVHFTAHSFHILEDYGISEGFITVLITSLVHLPTRKAMKIVTMFCGAVGLAVYLRYNHSGDQARSNNQENQERSDDGGQRRCSIEQFLNVFRGGGIRGGGIEGGGGTEVTQILEEQEIANQTVVVVEHVPEIELVPDPMPDLPEGLRRRERTDTNEPETIRERTDTNESVDEEDMLNEDGLEGDKEE